MHIYPSCFIKALSDCEPNQLVRGVGHRGAPGWFCLVATVIDQPKKRALIILNDGSPAYHIINEPKSLKVLAFESRPTLAVDPLGPFEAQAQTMFNANGVVSRYEDKWLMRVREYHAVGRPYQGCLDLETGTLIESVEDLNDVAFFGKWCISLPAVDENATPVRVASFEWKEPSVR